MFAIPLIGCCCLTAIPSVRPLQELDTGPVPDWVERAEIGPPSDHPVGGFTEGTYVLLMDTQDRFVDGTLSTFCDDAWYVHNTQGVQGGSQIEIDFDPSYQHLTIHEVEVIRDGVVIDRLKPAEIQVLQREEDLDFQIYDGGKTALVFVEDVRPGDVVRHAYTLEGSNPAYEGHYVRSVELRSYDPVKRIRHRLLWPADRPLTIRAEGPGTRPSTSELDGFRDYRWEAADTQPLDVGHALPTWYVPEPWVQLTDFRDWNEVARWGADLLAPPREVGPELAAEIDSIRRANETPLDRALAATRFVQDEVRYLGIELGAGAYAASDPDTVHARRFGDCKDKSLLLTTILGGLGIDAHIGLVSTDLGRTIASLAPSPLLFDHAIVRIDLPGGPFWVDPTESLVGGDLPSYEPPPFGMALVADRDAVAPEPIPEEAGRPSSTHIRYTIDASHVGDTGTLEVATRYDGRRADEFREAYGWTTPERFAREGLDYYRSFYPSAKALEPIEVVDDREENVVRTTERYEIPGLWADYDGRWWAQVYSLEIDDLLPESTVEESEYPIGVSHPERYEHTILVRLGDGDWALGPESEVVENAGYRFTYASAFDDGTDTLRIDYTYRSKADHVPPEATADFLADVERTRALLGYDIPYTDGSWPGIAVTGGAVLLGFLSAGTLAGILVVRSRRRRRATDLRGT